MPLTTTRERDDGPLLATALVLALYLSAALLFVQGLV